MIYQVNAKLILDTRTNKVVIEGLKPYHRIVLFPGKKVAEHWADVLLDDRHQGTFSYAKDLCKFLCQSLHGPKQHKKVIKGGSSPNQEVSSDSSS